MPGDAGILPGMLLSFLVVLTRMGGAIVFVPLPGFRTAPAAPKAILIASLTLVMLPRWPAIPLNLASADGAQLLAQFLALLAGEAALGILLGLGVAFLNESFVLAMQFLGFQAGYSYAATIDPNTQADSSVLQVIAQLVAALLFLAAGLDRVVLAAFARSFEVIPPGGGLPAGPLAPVMIGMGAQMFVVALRLALPVIALLLMVDITLALLGRLDNHLQLLTAAFPVKMLAAMLLLAATAPLLPGVYGRAAEQMLRNLLQWAGPQG